MKGLICFTKKEFLELLRSYKALILLLVFLIFGIMSPVLAKMLPEIMASMPMEGITLTIPDPTFLDAYTQFFKNITQMGLIVVLLVFGGTLSNEFSKGTLTMLLAKGLPRDAVILAKYTASVSLWTVSYLLAAAVNYGYTLYLFGVAWAPQLLFSLFCLWLFGAFLVSLIFITSVLTTGNYGGLLMTAGIVVVLMILNMIPGMSAYNPLTLASENMALITNVTNASDLWGAVLIAILSTVVLLVAAIAVFRKKVL